MVYPQMDSLTLSSPALDLRSLDPDSFLTRDQAAEALTEAGFPTSPATLATKATRGGGPKFAKWGARAVYRVRDLLDWAEGKLSAPIRSTSELDAQRAGKPRLVAANEPTLPAA